ncbi:MAG: hypothetical protein IJN45_02715 [Alistipes sp.]|nr:hypothetical protein [Alistipes sp.]
MNIEFIKSEIKRLSLIVEDWREGESVPTIERDLALDKIKSLYNILRFGEAEGAAEQYTIPVAPPAADDDNAAEECEAPEEKDVEVEFIFAEEDEEGTVDEVESEEEQSANDEITETATEIAAATINVGMPEVDNADEKQEEEIADVVEPKVVEQPTVATAVVEEQPIEDKKPLTEEKSKVTASINSLFGADEPRREPRSKHQRMMSIYNDEPKPEKVVDISKIFDMDDDESDVEIFATPTPKPQPQVKRVVEYDEEPLKSGETIADVKTVTLADAMAQNATTLADTIAAPAALGEEINHSHIRSLRKAIGINDKFLMIRDLFGGDGDLYEQTLDALDEFESFDDCLLYIAENHPEWNPDSEGAKFLTQLLERKLL